MTNLEHLAAEYRERLRLARLSLRSTPTSYAIFHLAEWDHPYAKTRQPLTMCGLRVERAAIARGTQHANLCAGCLKRMEVIEGNEP